MLQGRVLRLYQLDERIKEFVSCVILFIRK